MERHNEQVFRTVIDDSGRVSIPAALRAVLGITKGDAVFLVQEGSVVTLRTPAQALQRAQEVVRQYIPRRVDLVEELLAERRLEVERERDSS